jgi:hypothetical protein
VTLAYKEHQQASEAVTSLLVIDQRYKDPPNPKHTSKVEGLRGGSVVLMVAIFENYLKSVVTEIIESINTASPPCDFNKLPLSLQSKAVYSGLESVMKPKYGPLASKQLHERLPDIFMVIARLHSGKLISDSIANTAGNPNSKQVNEIFKAIGLNSVLKSVKPQFDRKWGSPTAVTFIEDTLNSIVERRHTVAHTGTGSILTSASRVDLLEWHRFLNVLVETLDRAIASYAISIIKKSQ